MDQGGQGGCCLVHGEVHMVDGEPLSVVAVARWGGVWWEEVCRQLCPF